MSEVEEDFWDSEIGIVDASNTLKVMFKPDYEKTKELDRINIYVSAEWNQIVRLLKKRLKHIGGSQQGVHFIRRRVTITGLQLLYDDNKAIIDKSQEKYDNDLETFDSLNCILAMQPRSIYQHEHTRRLIYVKEETLGWIQDIADVFNLNAYSVVRVAWSYTFLKLIELEYLPAIVSEHAKQDIELFKKYLSRM